VNPSLEFFQTFAECAITFAGFAAVHGVLQGSASPRGTLRSFSTMLPGLSTFLLALLLLIFQGVMALMHSFWLAMKHDLEKP
jgi:hypothetical protein